MLRFILHAGHRLTMLPYLERWAGDFANHIEVISYDELFRSSHVPRCVHVFTDLERLGTADRERAVHVWKLLRRVAPELEILNHPVLGMRRYELLRTMHELGGNDFDVYRLTEGRRPRSFPVFVRAENDHEGPESELLSSQAELDAAVASLVASGKNREERIAVEFHAARDEDGFYRKYAAFFLAGKVLPRHLMISDHWMIKSKHRIIDDEKLAEEWRYFETNPHAEWIASVFAAARLGYGRLDYGFVSGRPQVYEINSNPTIIPAEATERVPRNVRFAAELTKAYSEFEARNGGTAKPERIRIEPPLKGFGGRLISRVLAMTGRQFRSQV